MISDFHLVKKSGEPREVLYDVTNKEFDIPISEQKQRLVCEYKIGEKKKPAEKKRKKKEEKKKKQGKIEFRYYLLRTYPHKGKASRDSNAVGR
jgi:hypothetical protein